MTSCIITASKCMRFPPYYYSRSRRATGGGRCYRPDRGPGTHCLRMREFYECARHEKLWACLRKRPSQIMREYTRVTFNNAEISEPDIYGIPGMLGKSSACANSVYQAFPLLAEGLGTRLLLPLYALVMMQC